MISINMQNKMMSFIPLNFEKGDFFFCVEFPFT